MIRGNEFGFIHGSDEPEPCLFETFVKAAHSRENRKCSH
jgi:hypothetical protein